MLNYNEQGQLELKEAFTVPSGELSSCDISQMMGEMESFEFPTAKDSFRKSFYPNREEVEKSITPLFDLINWYSTVGFTECSIPASGRLIRVNTSCGVDSAFIKQRYDLAKGFAHIDNIDNTTENLIVDFTVDKISSFQKEFLREKGYKIFTREWRDGEKVTYINWENE